MVGIVVTACVANYWLSIIVIIIFVLLLLFRHYFLCTSRNIQRLEAIGNNTVVGLLHTLSLFSNCVIVIICFEIKAFTMESCLLCLSEVCTSLIDFVYVCMCVTYMSD